MRQPKRRTSRIDPRVAALGVLFAAYAGVLVAWGVGMLVRQQSTRADATFALGAVCSGLLFIAACRGLWASRRWSYPLAVIATTLLAVVSALFALGVIWDGLAGLAFGSLIIVLAVIAVLLTHAIRSVLGPAS